MTEANRNLVFDKDTLNFLEGVSDKKTSSVDLEILNSAKNFNVDLDVIYVVDPGFQSSLSPLDLENVLITEYGINNFRCNGLNVIVPVPDTGNKRMIDSIPG